jgi:hypothetical protein
MTAKASILYFSYLISMFNGKTIGLIEQKQSSHNCADIMEFIERCNKDNKMETWIVLELVDEGLTTIVQAPDVAVNKVFKSSVKKQFHTYRSGSPIKIGQKVSVSRKTMVQFILDAISDINHQHNVVQLIRDAFIRCGLNP